MWTGTLVKHADKPGFERRAFLGLGALIAAAPFVASAQSAPGDGEIIPLWPTRPPGAPALLPEDRVETRSVQGQSWRVAVAVGTPFMALLRAPRPNGAAMLLIPGGGYVNEWFDSEGYATARRFAEAGVTSFILRYRLPAGGWAAPSEAPLQDAQRAMRLIRAGAARYGIDPTRVAVLGFSAGGHLAASLATRGGLTYAPIDAADAGSTRPDLSALMYPVIEMAPPYAHLGSVKALLGPDPSAESIIRHSPRQHVDAATPPTFLVHASDDDLVPVENSLGYLAALRQAKVPAEGHIFEEGGHGFGLRQGIPASTWPDLFLVWASRRGYARG
jgi:acetyl esterase/lipase